MAAAVAREGEIIWEVGVRLDSPINDYLGEVKLEAVKDYNHSENSHQR
jgi:hypothetical protein